MVNKYNYYLVFNANGTYIGTTFKLKPGILDDTLNTMNKILSEFQKAEDKKYIKIPKTLYDKIENI